ncbi:hypothetical protein JAAARDRAFT_151180 [Jaapia argillacea MUCL 33604]|uniref:Pre-mRNA-splicing factor SYF1 n=1 Tax=Jaapia argillacea MUCL 33604 TaxID=933084 RepID=A0A067Q377_9AGAM|nr:hypothetical protein JAAARDRAFT_151180 [Jaapia argillacea MUCL 33604]
MSASASTSVSTLTSVFPLTFPLPTPATHASLIAPTDLTKEEDLLRNPSSFRLWWSTISTARDSYSQTLKAESLADIPQSHVTLLGPLASPTASHALQRLAYLYEAALSHFPGSFKLWKAYLQSRMGFVLGKSVVRRRAGGKKKFPEMREALEDEKHDLENWEGGLDGVVGWEEWKSLVATFERALMWLPKMPRLWLMYLSIFNHPKCPPLLSHSHARRTYDRALRTLPPSLHHLIWSRYLLFASSPSSPPSTLHTIYRRYLSIDPSLTESYSHLLLNQSPPKPLEAAKLLLGLAIKASKGTYESVEGKSPYQLLTEWLDVVEQWPEEVGLDVQETIKANEEEAANAKAESDANSPNNPQPASLSGPLIRFAGPPSTTSTSLPYSSATDPTSPLKINIESIIHSFALPTYPDQSGRLWAGLAAYWVKRGEFDRARDVYELGMKSVGSVRDFGIVFDAYVEFGEALVSALVEELGQKAEGGDEDDEEGEGEDEGELEEELDRRMKEFEELMDRRPFLVNDVLLRRNPNDVQEWEKRVALWGTDDEKVIQTYTEALSTINPRKATPNFYRLYVSFAKFYEEGGASSQKQPDLESARKVFERATKVGFKSVEDLAEVWCEWAEMELRWENWDEAGRVMQRAAAVPKNTKISYHDQSLPVQMRLFKSLKLWSFYVDLEESLGTVESTKAVYDKILELRIANAQIIVNYAAFLEEHSYFEESFKVYERGVELFTFPISFEIWNIYLSKFIKRYGGTKIERARDLFEQALEKCPPKSCKPLFLMYAKLEEDHGLAKRAMTIYDRATRVVMDEDKFEMFTIYIAKAAANYGLPATRPIYERAIELLPDRQTSQMCLRFASLERKLGEIDRARAIYAHASQFCDPRLYPDFWQEWYQFEIDTGSEDTFREMLRIKRSVQAQFNTEASYLAAQTMAARKGGAGVEEEDGEEEGGEKDPMAVVEKLAGNGKAGGAPAFVAAKQSTNVKEVVDARQEVNEEEIQISDEED